MNKRSWPWQWGVSGLSPLSDAQLLYRYAQLGEGVAFQQLMKRHGPLVWGVCQRLLVCVHDADDAFQATFVVLSKKASSLQDPKALSSWLYGVAHRIARKVRSQRKPALSLDTHEPAVVSADDLVLQEQARQLADAVENLPSNYREVFLLCEVEGLTAGQAAQRLGLPEGTVNSRLHRARARLRGLLSQHGITTALLLAGVAVPESLMAATLRSILSSTIPASVQALATGVITTMFWIKLTTIATIAASVGVIGLGSASVLAQGSSALPTNATSQVKAMPLDDKDRRILDLEAKLKRLNDELQATRDEAAKQRDQSVALQLYLKNQLVGVEEQKANERNRLAAKEQEMKRREEEQKVKAQLRLEMEAQRQQQLTRWNDAQKELAKAVIELIEQQASLEADLKQTALQERALERAIQSVERYEDEIRKLNDFGSDDPKIKKFKELCDKERQQVERLGKIVAEQRVANARHARITAQLQLRQKLLLEVEERLLRHQLELDR